MPLSAIQSVIDRVNERLDKTLHRESDGTYKPYVCIICDRILKPSTLAVIRESQLVNYEQSLRYDKFASLPSHHGLISDYSYKGENAKDWMKGMLLSPRASYLGAGRGRGTICGYSSCRECKESIIRKHAMPTYAIANKYYFGSLPMQLAHLNDVELALLTPVKAYGFTFTYSGGKQRNLQGVLSYFRVKEFDIARAVMQLEVLGLNEHVVVLYTGEFTKEQREKLKERSSIRVDAVLDAVQWLVANHRLWKDVDIEKIKKQLTETGAIIIDESSTVDGSKDGINSNIETTETFVAYFPDGTMKTVSGGQASIDEFKSLVERSKYYMQQLEFQCILGREAASDFQDDNFVRACLLQFPYGVGGMNERRLKPDGSLTSSVDMIEYVRHLSYISQPHFHRPLFVLILYSIYQRQIMLKTSYLNVRGDVTYTDFAQSLNADDVDQAVAFRLLQQEQRRNGYSGRNVSGGTFVSNKYLNSIDAITRALPHTNAASARARTEGECVSHYEGFPSVFLSLSPDDENSFLLQIFTGVTIDDETPVDSLTDEQLAERAKYRRELRIRSPGMCAFTFEIILEIVLEEVVGVDMEKKEVIKEGFFGLVDAVMVAIEEQGRKTLHAHILLWIAEIQKLLKRIQDDDETQRRRTRAKIDVAEKYDNVCTTNLIGNSSEKVLREVFKHENCTGTRIIPSSVDDQQLRNLRHKIGCAATNYVFAVCETCRRTWTHEETVQLYLQRGAKIPRFGEYPDNCRRLNALCVQYQKPTSAGADPCVVNAAYNTHFSFHTASCFPSKNTSKTKIAQSKTKRKSDECRMRLPDLKRAKCCVNETRKSCWYKWDGTRVEKTMLEINPRRRKFDEFQNVSCPVISETKSPCNSNVKFIAPGPVLVYTTKYTAKPTQEEETEHYGRVAKETRAMLSDQKNQRKHADDKREAMRRVLRASFAHNKKNIIGPTLASWLTRKGSRFMISKNFAWCPLRDIDNLLKRETLNLRLKCCHGVNFFENSALHYLCRPHELEDVDVARFYTEYEVKYISRKKKEEEESEIIPFKNTEWFMHPSYKAKADYMAQGVKKRDETLVLKLHQWYFEDSEKFNGSILSEDTTITSAIEQYSRLVLMLFLPFRCENDLTLQGSHTRKLRECVKANKIRQSAFEYLQNVQDARSNALRNAPVEDELARKTIPFQAADDGLLLSDSDDDGGDSDNDDELDPSFLDTLLNDMFLSTGTFDDEQTVPTKLNFSRILEKGTKKCGFDKIVDVSVPAHNSTTFSDAFIRTSHNPQSTARTAGDDSQNRQQRYDAQKTKSRRDIVRTILTYKDLRKRRFPTFSKDDSEVSVKRANGSAASIIDWGKKAKLDKKQRRTFEILASTFVLTFFDNAREKDISNTRIGHFVVEHSKLHCLSKRSKQNESLVSFVHGPGGAGKSTIVDLVILYCREYCEVLGFPFTSQTIVVTALTGVAATILLGETTHRAVHINRKKEFSADDINIWKETRLLIVDEVSFAAPSLFEKLDDNLRLLTEKWLEPYGGVNIVFSGDLRQLKPVREISLCDVDCPHFDDWMNCYIELDGKHRFKNDPKWGELLFRFRNGYPTTQDIQEINKRVCYNTSELPSPLKYATHKNRDRDAINTAIFSKYCNSSKDNHTNRVRSAIIILSDNLKVKKGDGSFVAVTQRQNFWQSCGEDDVECRDKKNGRVDPALKLFRNCPVMLTRNDDVKAGKANGTRAVVEHVVLKRGENHFDVVVDDCVVPTVFASQVEYVQLRHENENIHPQVFGVKPRQYSIRAYISQPGSHLTQKHDKDKVDMQINQLPITSNTATTGHKLQGSGVDDLFVHDWHYGDNWPYVVLSRVTTILGLFLREPLSYDLTQYAMSSFLKRKLEKFQRDKMRPLPTDEEYQWMESPTVSSVGQPATA